ncbi:MAG TPA: YbjN domain-containing protein [Chitinophagales bacterium]|nr:YbjN domain-containing protein [Chitinophagales bacterium]
MSDLQKTIQMVENSIRKLGIDPSTCKGEKEGQYSLNRGSAAVWIDVWHIEKEGRAYFQVMSPIMDVVNVSNKPALYEELLQINDQLFNVAFTLYNNWVWLKTLREVDSLDENEIYAQITRVGNYADRYDDELKQKYNAFQPPRTGEQA